MRHKRLAGLEHFLGLRLHVTHQPKVASHFVGDNVERRFEDACNGRDRTAFGPQPRDLRAEGVEVLHHSHTALD